jgi:hypothetical protein
MLQEGEDQPGSGGQGALAQAGGGVKQRGAIQDEVALAGRGTVVLHDVDRGFHQPFGQLGAVGDGGGGQEELGRRAVSPGQAPQPSQHVRHVAAEHPPVDVGLIDHHKAQMPQEIRPAGMLRQDPHVQHVGVGQDQASPLPDETSRLGRRVPIVRQGGHRELQGEEPGAQDRALIVR